MVGGIVQFEIFERDGAKLVALECCKEWEAMFDFKG